MYYSLHCRRGNGIVVEAYPLFYRVYYMNHSPLIELAVSAAERLLTKDTMGPRKSGSACARPSLYLSLSLLKCAHMLWGDVLAACYRASSSPSWRRGGSPSSWCVFAARRWLCEMACGLVTLCMVASEDEKYIQ
jgi:hypothetical protein